DVQDQGRLGDRVQRQGQAAPLRPHRGPPAQLEKGLCAARCGAGNQFRGDAIGTRLAMPLIKVKPTSPGRRALVKVVTPELHKGDPHWALLSSQSKTNGRNNYGRVTMRHKGGGHKQHYRTVDFRRDKDGIAAKVEHIEY